MSKYLAHYGTKGMKWGVVNEEETEENYDSKTEHYKEYADKLSNQIDRNNKVLDTMVDKATSINDKNELLRTIMQFNALSNKTNNLSSKLSKLKNVIYTREQKAKQKASKSATKKSTKSETKYNITPTNTKFYKATPKWKNKTS